MTNGVSKTAFGAALGTAALSIIWLFIPYGQPWPSVLWAVLACVAAVWAANSGRRPSFSMGEVIRSIEAESPRDRVAPASAVRPTGLAS